MTRTIRAGRAFIKSREPKQMTHEERERVLTLKEATRDMNPQQYVAIRVADLDYLTGVILAHAPEQSAEDAEKKPDIDGGFTKEAGRE
jgi:hypothetical protein